ncbi:16S rRNA (guanine(966)-N(2))-methyltransferase RsmD [Amphritea japonica]|uniref:Ribosomal RNA small subunit methyltransferase D n=1 Tax=Amphritea japonica ATCC BAA-1530 TaxID=1278309 RepID=A0A7R6P090_9GAMM|nr:16S rRNA (guanine(966)-N(2))-methyltransferase RsmD [Amphritea japonica]BBB24738.1 16S rRNA (guanine966-N2)-methyltransferase [Amphritea japonica ATCC BAA-1530]
MARRRPQRPTQKVSSGNQQVRIIGGEWRGRKLNFPEIEGLRPTPDRVRETLFNWLSAYVPGGRCLDMFSGSGALGFEALSRGAIHVTMIDNSAEVIHQLRQNIQELKSQHAELVTGSVVNWLEARSGDLEIQYDIVFMDPPFNKDLAPLCCLLLEQKKMLADNAMIYVETEKEMADLQVPDNWELYREKTAGQVTYRLYQRRSC